MTQTGSEIFETALDELGAVVRRIDDGRVDAACAMLAGAGKIAVYGCGREALQVKGFAMRLFHLGLPVAVVGDMTTPPLGRGDLLVVSAGPGSFSTVLALLGVARESGARTMVVTAQPDGEAPCAADVVIHLPAQTMADDGGPATSVLPMGSLYEAVQLLFFDVLAIRLRERLGRAPDEMRARHTNLE